MQEKRLGAYAGINDSHPRVINRLIKRLLILRHYRKKFIQTLQRSERIKLIRRLRRLESLLAKISRQISLQSNPFVQTVISGRGILLHKSVLISRSEIHLKLSKRNYSLTRLDRMIKNLVNIKNNLDRYSVIINENKRASILRILVGHTETLVINHLASGNQKSAKEKSEMNSLKKKRINKSILLSQPAKNPPLEKETLKKENLKKKVINSSTLRGKPTKNPALENKTFKKDNVQNMEINSITLPSKPTINPALEKDTWKKGNVQKKEINSITLPSKPTKNPPLKKYTFKKDNLKNKKFNSSTLPSKPMINPALKKYTLKKDNLKNKEMNSSTLLSKPAINPALKKYTLKKGNLKNKVMNSSTLQIKPTINPALKKYTLKKEKKSELNSVRKQSKYIKKYPMKSNDRESYNPYDEQDLDVFIDSLLEDLDREVNADEFQDSN